MQLSYRHIIFFFIILSIFFLLDTYLWRGYRRTAPKKYFQIFKWLLPLSTLFFISGGIAQYVRGSKELYNGVLWLNLIFGLGFGFIVVKIVAGLILFLEDIYRFGWFAKKKITKATGLVVMPDRRDFVRKLSLGAASLPLLGSVYAVTKGKYAFHEKQVHLYLKRLPKSFEGLKVVQFSDFHAGSFDDFEKVKEGLALINKANPDIILFTGDLVNNRSIEALPYVGLLKDLKAKYGKFAVLGNHDYGDYIQFDTPEERVENLLLIEQIYKDADFQLLNNESVQISNDIDTIDLIGVENWGTGPFPQYGKIPEAIANTEEDRFNILMSHDPDHWEYEIRNHSKQFDLTLSGHTHGFQVGVSIPGWEWSPAKYRYKRWLGLYQENNRYLFVSKGFGFLGFAGRIGMLPEIVVFTLHCNE